MEDNKPKRGRPPLTKEEKKERAIKRANGELPIREDHQLKTDPGDNSRFLRHALVTMGMPPIDISDVTQVEERINWYFHHCIDNDMKPTVTGLCNSLGITRDTLIAWRTGKFRSDTHQATAAKAHLLLEELMEDYMQNGKINPVSGIFLMKNLYANFSDKQEVVLTPNTQTLSDADVATIEAKYAELPDVDGE